MGMRQCKPGPPNAYDCAMPAAPIRSSKVWTPIRWRFGWRWVWSCWFLLAGLPWTAQAQVVPIERAFWVDPTGQAGIAQVVSAPFEAMPAAMSLGYTPAHLWVRVTVPPTPHVDLVAAVRPSFLDYVSLYSQPEPTRTPLGDAPAQEQSWQERRQGDKLPFASRERNDLSSAFHVRASATMPTVFYVRVHTTSFLAVSVTLATERATANRTQVTYLGIGLWAGLIVLIGVYSLARWLVSRDALWGINALVQATAILLIGSHTGLGDKHLSPDAVSWWGHEGGALLSCLNLFCVLLYFWRFTLAFGAPRWLVWLLATNLLLLPLQLWAIGQGMVREALEANSYLLGFRSVVAYAMAFLLVIHDSTLRWLIRVGFYAIATYGLWYVVPLLGLAPLTEAHLYPPIGSAIGALIQFAVLLRRDGVLRRERIDLRLRVQRTEERLAWEQQRLSERASFMDMLLHELKNPLASIRLATYSLAGERALSAADKRSRANSVQRGIDSIDPVLDRCRQVDKLEQGQLGPVQSQGHDATALLGQWLPSWPEPGRVQLDLPPQLLLHTDAALLNTMVGNLVHNALAYSPAGSMVRLRLRSECCHASAPMMVLQVRNAVGKVGPPDAQRLFSKYYRGAQAHHQTGSGLGLYLVQSLAKLARGSVRHWMEEQTVVFEITLPIHA